MGTSISCLLKIIIRTIAIAGVVIMLANLKGYFIDKNRQHTYTQLVRKYNADIATPGVNEFLNKYYYTEKIPPKMLSYEISGLVLKWIGIGIRNQPMSGTIHVEYTNGERTTALCRLDELKQWSSETPFYAWLGWWLLAIGVISETIIDIIEFRKKRLVRNNT